ncbi:MAG: YggS family pyridoxal phosphate-dependent enzyme [Magnetospirillum sp.]|nr:YggS family pyridoxal phosphate-dependent enzyme [Magnetospirillum sp.]
MSEVVANLIAVRQAIAAAARQAGRDAASVALVAVSKTHDAEDIVPVLEAGQRCFGENRVQEAKAKWPALKDRFPGVELHLIGPLQTNKVRDALALFDVVESIDRPKLARAVADEMGRSGRRPSCCIQVNTGREAQKAGVDPDQADRFVALCRDEFGLPLVGVMGIPPSDADPEPHFRLLADIAARNGLTMISMGMSGDYAAAIRLGATHVRVGSAIFGARG